MWIVLDFETASDLNLKKVGAWRYSLHPNTEVLCVHWRTEDGRTGKWHPGEDRSQLSNFALNPTVVFCCYAPFEMAVWLNLMVADFGFPSVPLSRWHDIQAVAAMKSLPLQLNEMGRVLGLQELKDDDGSQFTISLSKPNKAGYYDRSAPSLARVDDYCEQDVKVETEAHTALGFLPPEEHKFWQLHTKINQRGLALDRYFISAAQKVVDGALRPLVKEFQSITRLNPTQGIKYVEWLRDQGVPVPNLQKETVVRLLNGDDIDAPEHEEAAGEAEAEIDDTRLELPDHVRRSLVIRQLAGSSSIKKLARMEECMCQDGRARYLLQYHGTSPGRSSGRMFQPLNFPRGTVKLQGPDDKELKGQTKVDAMVKAIMSEDADVVEFTTGYPALEVVVSSLRHAIIAGRGRCFLSGDYAGIQARVVLALSGQNDRVDRWRTDPEYDPYCDMASLIFKRRITKADAAERQYGKNSVLGLGFQMGWKKFKIKYARDMSDEFCQNIVKTYREEFAPCVPKLWKGLERAAVAAVHDKTPHEAFGVGYAVMGNWLTASLPSGRMIWYRNPRPTRRLPPWEGAVPQRSFSYQTQKNGRWVTVDAYGGLLTENVVMGIEVDIQRHGMFLLEKNGFPITLEVYDEIVAEPLQKDADEKAFAQIMVDQPDWVKAIGVPIATETWQGDRYRK